jgi:LPXTG-motif cell wall-anchored protein
MADTDPDALERQIERTRAELARTVDAIADRVSPKRIAGRSVARVRANAEHLVSVFGDAVDDVLGNGKAHQPVFVHQDDWPDDPPGTDSGPRVDPGPAVGPVLIGLGAVLVVGAAVVLFRRRRR